MNIQNCPKCKSIMEEGFVLDNADGGQRRVSEWVEGAPQKSFWLGIKLGEAREIVTYRCKSCGFLESYAKQDRSL